ncbi:hypothetical protein LTS14_010140 [Recurvomyces mirabilis]|uniref:uncharacterized protein n=1 Tax=Recurvomyces mirabilis TaxID=574656 RepID=UPI002DE06314|nr:hypothetical protein LTS14_010140 [Recurvomyces mirabilis]
MPTQRSYLSNFLAAFRAHSQTLPKASPSISTSAAAASTATIWTTAVSTTSKPQSTASEHTASSPRPINPKVNPYAAAAAATQSQQQATPSHQLQHLVSPTTHLPRSPSSPSVGPPVYGPPNKPQPNYPTVQEARQARRRGSASSSDSSGGFREVRPSEKWFVGGRTATGEEKYYKLSMVKRERSADRISADQLSL